MNKSRKIQLFLAAAALAAAGFYYYHRQTLPADNGIARSNGRLELRRLDVATLYPGRVQTLHVNEGDEVKAGDALAELSSDTSSGRLAEARAAESRQEGAVKRAQAAGEQTRRTVERAAANVEAARRQQRVAKMEWDNARRLLADGLVSPAEAERRRADYERAGEGVKAAEAARAEAQAAVAQSLAAESEARAGVRQAAAAVKTAESANDDMTIRAPIAGRIEYKIAEVGSVVAAGSKIVSLLDPADVSMNIFLPNRTAGRLKVGDEARIRLDGTDTVFPAAVSFIAAEAQFTPKAVETADERERLMLKVRLKIPADAAAGYNRLLKGGMTGEGFVKTDEKAAWPPELAVKLPQ